ncbi:MAG: GNAT family N-acetyltransferase [Erysipelotrichaceae bacterium]|nr:GNAT family N-acetyltransferase [Erysipelotrichaceae bacterium]
MEISVTPYTADRIDDVVKFENDLRQEEQFWGWEINEEYIRSVRGSFYDESFKDSVSLIAYADGKVVGRIDSSMISSHFDGSTKAYLDWICVLKSYRHKGVAQKLMNELRKELGKRGINTLIGLTASNDEAKSFYEAIPDSIMRDIGIWINVETEKNSK